jgi:hypothetical protein
MNSVADVPSLISLPSALRQKKTGNRVIVAGFTIRSLRPVVTTLGCQFIASTTFQENSWSGHNALSVPVGTCEWFECCVLPCRPLADFLADEF